MEDDDWHVTRGARREVGNRSTGVRRDGAKISALATEVMREVSTHREAGGEDVRRVQTLIVGHVGVHRVDEGEVDRIPVVDEVSGSADVLPCIRRVPRCQGAWAALAVGERKTESIAVGEGGVLRNVVHLLSAHRSAVKDEHERNWLAGIQ